MIIRRVEWSVENDSFVNFGMQEEIITEQTNAKCHGLTISIRGEDIIKHTIFSSVTSSQIFNTLFFTYIVWNL